MVGKGLVHHPGRLHGRIIALRGVVSSPDTPISFASYCISLSNTPLVQTEDGSLLNTQTNKQPLVCTCTMVGFSEQVLISFSNKVEARPMIRRDVAYPQAKYTWAGHLAWGTKIWSRPYYIGGI